MKKCTRTAAYWVPTPGGAVDLLLCPAHARATGRRMVPLERRDPGKTCGHRVAKLSGK